MSKQQSPSVRASAQGADIPLPMPPASSGACWAGTAARMGRQAQRFHEPQCTCHAMDAGDRSAHTLAPHERISLDLPPDVEPLTMEDQIELARREALNSGVRLGAEYRCMYDTFTGALWGVAFVCVLMLASAGAGFLSVKWGG